MSHRLSAIRDADQILVLRRGRIAEIGRHDELLKMARLYFRLFSIRICELKPVRSGESPHAVLHQGHRHTHLDWGIANVTGAFNIKKCRRLHSVLSF